MRYKGLESGDDGESRFVFEVGRMRISAVASIEAGTLRLRSLSVSGPEITSAMLRSVPLSEIKRRIISELKRHPALAVEGAILREIVRGSGDRLSPEVLARLDEAEQKAHRRVASLRDPGPRKHSADFWRDVGLAYLRALEGEPRRAVDAMATDYHRPMPTVSGWIRRAREEGWLSEGQQGRAGAEPGPKLIEWLEEGEPER